MQRLLATCLLLALVMTLAPWAAATEDPTWEVGDETAMGTEEDFSELFDAFSEDLRAELDDDPDVESYTLDNQGTVGLYYTSEVVDDSGGLYRVDSEIGFYVHVFTQNAVMINVPVAGNYTDVVEEYDEMEDDYFYRDLPTEVREVAMEAGADFVVRLAITEYYTQNELDLQEIEFTLTVGASFNFKGNNLPDERNGSSERDPENGTETYEWYSMDYRDVSWGGSAEVSASLQVVFDPALNFYDLPITEGEVWGGVTNVTMSGELWGKLDLQEPQGVPSELMGDFYEQINDGFAEGEIDLTIDEWGDLFPLYIPDYWMPVDEFNNIFDEDDVDFNLRIEGQRFAWGPVESPEPVAYNFTTGAQKNVTLPDGTTVTAFEIVSYDDHEEGSRGGGTYSSGSVTPGDYYEYTVRVDEGDEELDLYYYLEDNNGDGESRINLTLEDPNGNVIWERHNEPEGNGSESFGVAGDPGQYTFIVQGDAGDMYYDVSLDVYGDEGNDPFGDLEFIPYVGADSGRIVDLDVESQELTDLGVDLDVALVTPAEAQDALATKANPTKPSQGGVNEDADWNQEPEEQPDNPLPAPGLLAAAGLLAVVARRRR